MITKQSCWKSWKFHRWIYFTNRVADVQAHKTGVQVWRQCFDCGLRPLTPYRAYERTLDMEELFDIQNQLADIAKAVAGEE